MSADPKRLELLGYLQQALDLPEYDEDGKVLVGVALEVLNEEDTLSLRLKLDGLIKGDPGYSDLLFRRTGTELWLLRRSRCGLSARKPRGPHNAEE